MKTQVGNVMDQYTMSNKDIRHYIKFKLAIGCLSWCKCFYMMSDFEDWENIIHFGNFFWFNWEKNILFGFGSIGKKTYFLAFCFIAGKNHCVLSMYQKQMF